MALSSEEVVRLLRGYRAELPHLESPQISAALVEQVAQAHRRQPLDLLFGQFSANIFTPASIRAVRQFGILTVNYSVDDRFQFHRVAAIAPAFDYCVTNVPAAFPSYAALGIRPLKMHMGADPDLYQPQPLPQEFDLTFVGQRYADRAEHIQALLEAGLPVQVWGGGWLPGAAPGPRPPLRYRLRGLLLKAASRAGRAVLWGRVRARLAARLSPAGRRREARLAAAAHPPLSDFALVAMFSRTRVNLGFSGLGDVAGLPGLHMTRLRDLEVPMCAGFYLAGASPELAELYELEREVVTFASPAELVDKARFYLAHPAERERIRQAGFRRARRDHTWTRRFEQLFAEIGLPARGPV